MNPPKLPSEAAASTVAWRRCEGIVYFLAVGKPYHVAVKIGMAALTGSRDLRATVMRRLSQIQSSNHEQVELLGLKYFTKSDHEFPTYEAEKLEQKLHKEFRHIQRFKPYTRGAEWFTRTDALVARIEEIACPPEHWNLPRYVCSPLDEGDQS